MYRTAPHGEIKALLGQGQGVEPMATGGRLDSAGHPVTHEHIRAGTVLA